VVLELPFLGGKRGSGWPLLQMEGWLHCFSTELRDDRLRRPTIGMYSRAEIHIAELIRRTRGAARRRCHTAVRRSWRRASCARRRQVAPAWRRSTGTVRRSSRRCGPPSPRRCRSPPTTFQTERCADWATRSPTTPRGTCRTITQSGQLNVILTLVYTVRHVPPGSAPVISRWTISTGTVHTSAKAHLTSVAIRIRVQIRIQIRDLDAIRM